MVKGAEEGERECEWEGVGEEATEVRGGGAGVQRWGIAFSCLQRDGNCAEGYEAEHQYIPNGPAEGGR